MIMNYIILDLELNSKAFKSRHPNEIIEIGAIKLNTELKETGAFQAFVKPKVYRKLFPIVKRKTHISQDDINNAESFKVVLTSFKEWIGKDYILCCWGHDDIHHLKSNCEFNRRSTGWLKRSVDIQKQFSKISEAPSGQRVSLKNALIMLGIPLEEKLHRADADARYTAEVFKRIFNSLDLKIH